MKIVLLHGFCEDRNIWNEMLLYPKQKKNIICLDLPGFGRNSSFYRQAETVELMADFVYEEIEKLKINDIILIGHSLGGYVALAFAEKYPHLLSGLGLFHSSAMPDNEERKAGRLKTIEFVKTHGEEAYHKVLIPNLFKSDTSLNVLEHTIDLVKTAKANGIIASLNAMRIRPGRINVLENFEKPILFIAGESDTLIPKGTILAQAALSSIAQIEVLANSAHMGQIEEAERSAEIIDSFYDFVSGSKK